MIHRQYFISFLVLFFSISLKAEWFTEPYLGYGQLTTSLGNKAIIDGEGMGYLLGAKTGLKLNSLFIGADYARSGPFKVMYKSSIYGTSITSGLFTSYSGGLGLKYSFGSWSIWYGRYPYHVLEEQRIDFQMKGSMNRWGLGFVIDQKTLVYFQYESSKVQMSNPNATTTSILCYGSPINCPLTGESTIISFVLSAAI